MAYGLKYTSEFDSIKPLQAYSVNIFQKDYVGDPLTVLLSGTPAVQEWQEDDPKAPIRGCTLRVSILTDVTGVRLTDFYSEDDTGFYVELRCTITDQYLFKGFLLQDDCKEIQLDFNHEISLLFTDMLGTLKDVTLDQAAVITGSLENHSVLIGTPPGTLNTITTQDIRFGGLQPGVVFTINDGTLAGTYTIISISLIPTLGVYDYWIVTNQIIGYTLPYTASIDWIDPYPLVGYVPIIDILKLCLKATFLDMRLKSVVSIFPTGGTNETTWDDTLIEINTFFDGNNWANCYSILEQILIRFNASLFQANAMWNIVRWDEMYRYTTITGATMFGSNYDNNFILYASGAVQSDIFSFMDGKDMETGVMKSIERPLQYVKETFNYNNLPLIRNGNNQELGSLRAQYNSGPNTILEYDAPYWQENPLYVGALTFFIRVVRNSTTFEEIERYLVIKKTGVFDFEGIYQDVLVDKNDFFSFSQSIRYNDHVTPPIGGFLPLYYGVINLDDGATSYYLNGSTSSFLNYPTAYQYTIFHGDYSDNWHTISFENVVLLTSGRLRVWLPVGLVPGSGDELHLTDLNFTVKNNIAGSGLVNGHTHKGFQSSEIKNNIDKEIGLDVTNRYSIYGSLFLNTYTGFLINKATEWKYPGIIIDPVPNLGRATTLESLFTRFKARAKYEGNLLYVLQGNGPYEFITPLSIFKQYGKEELYRFVPGKMAIDYKNANVDLTLYELIDNMGYNFNGGLTAVYLEWAATKLYEFNYLFEN